MPRVQLMPASPGPARTALAAIEAEYLHWVDGELLQAFGPLAGPGAAATPAPPTPALLQGLQSGAACLITLDGEPAGMGGWRPLPAPQGASAEIKRLYVRPAYRGLALGQMALRALLADARHQGHRRVCLDSAPFMHAAQRLYAAHGFSDCAAYAGTEVPPHLHDRWRFMQRALP